MEIEECRECLRGRFQRELPADEFKGYICDDCFSKQSMVRLKVVAVLSLLAVAFYAIFG